MWMDVSNLMSMSEANQNFSLVARRCEEKGPVLILKNNKPRFLLLPFTREGLEKGLRLYQTMLGGNAMRKLTYRTITIDQPVEILELLITKAGTGIALDAHALSDQRAGRQATLFEGYAALHMAALRGLDAARDMLQDKGEPVALNDLRLPAREDSRALLATWFVRALAEADPARRVMYLYNAYGALPGGYAGVHAHAEGAGPGQGQMLLDAVAHVRHDEDDSGDTPPPPPADISRLAWDAHLMQLVKLSGV